MSEILTLVLTTVTVSIIQCVFHWVKDKIFGGKKNRIDSNSKKK